LTQKQCIASGISINLTRHPQLAKNIVPIEPRYDFERSNM